MIRDPTCYFSGGSKKEKGLKIRVKKRPSFKNSGGKDYLGEEIGHTVCFGVKTGR